MTADVGSAGVLDQPSAMPGAMNTPQPSWERCTASSIRSRTERASGSSGSKLSLPMIPLTSHRLSKQSASDLAGIYHAGMEKVRKLEPCREDLGKELPM